MQVVSRDYDGMQKEFKAFVLRTDTKLDSISATLSEAKGGWRVMMLIGGGCMATGAAIVKFLPMVFR
jgi:hypothetical protein